MHLGLGDSKRLKRPQALQQYIFGMHGCSVRKEYDTALCEMIDPTRIGPRPFTVAQSSIQSDLAFAPIKTLF
jgi:hypothetical protein